MITAREALERLREGNRRFVAGVRHIDLLINQTRLSDLVSGQEPFAIILGCSDSRVPVEIIFDQGLGDLFVIRIAGNIVASSQSIRANIRVSANHLRYGSEVLEELIEKEKLLVVCAEYCLETGIVDFFDGIPEAE